MASLLTATSAHEPSVLASSGDSEFSSLPPVPSKSFISLYLHPFLPDYVHLSPLRTTPSSSSLLSLNECSLTSGTYAAGCSIPSL